MENVLEEEGADFGGLVAVLGAADGFTLDKYSHLMPDDDQQAALAVAGLVDAAGPCPG